jgi:predicted DNA-binding transcriptional regulator AlpA
MTTQTHNQHFPTTGYIRRFRLPDCWAFNATIDRWVKNGTLPRPVNSPIT